MATPKTYFETLETSALPAKSHAPLYDIQHDEGLELLDEKNPILLEIQTILSEKYPEAVKKEEAPIIEPPPAPAPAVNKEYYAGLIKSMGTLISLTKDKAKKAEYEKTVKGYKLLHNLATV